MMKCESNSFIGRSARCRRRLSIRSGVAAVLCFAFACMSGIASAASIEYGGRADVFLSLTPACEFGIGIDCTEVSLLLTEDAFKTRFFAGLASLKWGPGRNGSLCLSGHASPMPVMGYRLNKGRSEYVRFVGVMENDRKLLGHRLDFEVNPWLSIGVAETGILSGDSCPLYYCPFPGLPLYALQHVIYNRVRSRANDMNVNLALDFTLDLKGLCAGRGWGEFGFTRQDVVKSPVSAEKNFMLETGFSRAICSSDIELYGEILIDDAQIHFPNRSLVPDFVGCLIGLEIANSIGESKTIYNVEYALITNYVYSHRVPANSHTYLGVSLGHPLGPDADSLAVTVAHWPDRLTQLQLKAEFERHGQGRIGLSWSKEYGLEDIFLSGVVEKSARCSFVFERELMPHVFARTSMGMFNVTNHENIEGSTYTGWSASIGVRLRL